MFWLDPGRVRAFWARTVEIFSSLYQFYIGFRYSLVLKNQVPVVIYGIHGAWIYSTPYVPVPQILDLPDLPDLPGRVNLGSIPNLRSTGNLLCEL